YSSSIHTAAIDIYTLSLHDALPILDLLKDLSDNHGWTIVLVTHDEGVGNMCDRIVRMRDGEIVGEDIPERGYVGEQARAGGTLVDRKSTRLNSSHVKISYAVFCLKK